MGKPVTYTSTRVQAFNDRVVGPFTTFEADPDDPFIADLAAAGIITPTTVAPTTTRRQTEPPEPNLLNVDPAAIDAAPADTPDE